MQTALKVALALGGVGLAYMIFSKPSTTAGKQVCWLEGDNKQCASRPLSDTNAQRFAVAARGTLSASTREAMAKILKEDGFTALASSIPA
jgi:hypothetical protein